MASIGQTLAGPRFHETDEVSMMMYTLTSVRNVHLVQWFDKQRTYLDGLESQLRGLVKSIEIVAKQRAGAHVFCYFFLLAHNSTDLASATGEFATAVIDLSASDLGEQLQQTLGALANVQQVAAEGQSVQSQQDMMTLMSTGISFRLQTSDRSISSWNSRRVFEAHQFRSGMFDSLRLSARFERGWEAGFQLPCANIHGLAKCRRRGPACTANTRARTGAGTPSNRAGGPYC